jgi:isoquinoline 1-oxidoreductase subunit beta
MLDVQNLSRRAFIIGTAAVTGGIAFGSYSYAQEAAKPASGNPLAASWA